MRIVQITDPHIFSDTQQGKLLGVNTSNSFEAVLQLVEQAPKPPDMIILTGDLSQDETQAAYEYIAKMCKRFQCPVTWLPGNHDDPALMEAVFRASTFQSDKAIIMGNWLFILLNTHYPKHVEGLLSKNELSRLEYYLDLHRKLNCMIFMHHPPVSVGSKWVDNLKLKNADNFFAITDKFPNIKAIVCGHVHQAFHTTRKNVDIFTTPSTCIQFKSNSASFALDKQNPGYRWFDLTPKGSFKTGVERLVNYNNSTDFSSSGY